MKNFNTFDLDIFTEIGLSDKEALIYLAAIDLGGGTISQLADSINIERTGIYYHIEKLLKLGLLKPEAQGKRLIYFPADPEKLKKIVEERQNRFLGLLPQMEQVFSRQRGKSIAEYYQGKDELEEFYDRVYGLFSQMDASNNVIYVLGSSFSSVAKNRREFLKFKEREEQLNVTTKAILPQSQKSKDEEGNKKDPYIVTRYNLPPAELRFISDKYTYPGAVTIAGNYVVLYDYKSMFYSITENKNIANTWRMFFEFIWDNLPSK